MKQTEVEWLIEQLFSNNEIFGVSKELFEQAKEMEKEQIMEAHYAPKYGCFSKDYYNETFKSE